MSAKTALMIWTPEGTWLQTYGPDGGMRLSDCGVLALEGVVRHCRSKGIELEVRVGEPGRRRLKVVKEEGLAQSVPR